MNIQPSENRVLIKAIVSEQETKSGLIVKLDTTKERPEQAKVIAIGKRYNDITNSYIPVDWLEVGDIVLILKHAGVDFVHPTETEDFLDVSEWDQDKRMKKRHVTYTLIELDDIIGILK